MSKAAPAIPLFGDAYLADTRHLSLEEHGAYLQLLMIAWRTEGCGLPNDDARLARMLSVSPGKWKKLKPSVMSFWECIDGQWRQRRLTKERQFVEEKRAKNKQAADARWSHQATENKEPEPCERISERNAPPPPPPLEESVSNETLVPKPADEGSEEGLALKPDHLQEAWNAGPGKQGAVECRRMGPERRRKAVTFLRRYPIEDITEAIAALARSEFLCGRGRETFRADITFLFSPEHMNRLLEGFYDR